MSKENVKRVLMSSAIFVDATLNFGCETKSPYLIWHETGGAREGLDTPYTVQNMW